MKKKLTIEEQIEDLKKKGIGFNIIDEGEAKKFLRYNNYYFKLKSYARNYPINPRNGKYVNLEFAYLIELSKLDMYLRKIILGMCLDLEHILKTRMLYDISRNEKEDGYHIVKKYFWAYPETNCQGLFNQIHKKGARSTAWLLTPRLTDYIFPFSRSLQRYA